jgi:phosphatidate cytidylyltransferase
MLRDRALVALILLPIGLFLVYLGGWYYLGVMLFMVGVAAWEYGSLFRAGEFRPARFLMVAVVIALMVGRYLNAATSDPFHSDAPILAIFTLLAMTFHLLDYERGRNFSGTDFAITLSGGLYFGFLGGFLVPLRQLPNGFWWFLTFLPSVWLADSGAYFVGRRFGRRRFSPRLSPKKSWEGYLAGVATGTLGTGLLVLLWGLLSAGAFELTFLEGALIGLVLAAVTPLGDLGKSMIKRQVGIKDSGRILPGHGGMFDRIDTWIWAAVLGYYCVSWFFV